MAEIATVKVKADSELGYIVINESDFNEDEHTLYKDPKPQTPQDKTPVDKDNIQSAETLGKVESPIKPKEKQRRVTVVDHKDDDAEKLLDTQSSDSGNVLKPIL